jgi:hypothetical protein
MNKEQAKNLGENIGIFMVCVGICMLYMPFMRILVELTKWYAGGAQ